MFCFCAAGAAARGASTRSPLFTQTKTNKGARFLAGDTTIKLRCGESYSFTLSVTPGLELA